jgi:hypothetical protein
MEVQKLVKDRQDDSSFKQKSNI